MGVARAAIVRSVLLTTDVLKYSLVDLTAAVILLHVARFVAASVSRRGWQAPTTWGQYLQISQINVSKIQ